MMSTDSLDDKWSTAETEIMQATYQALLTHGYADLSILDIAEELDKSKSALYYHYDSKEDLFIAFLEFAVDQFESSISTESGEDPREDLDHFIEKLLPLQPDEDQRQLQEVLVGLRSQSATNAEFRKQFTRIDERLATTIQEIIEQGIEMGTFCDVDPTRVAEHILATINGARYTRATTDRENAAAAVRVSLASYIDTELRRRS